MTQSHGTTEGVVVYAGSHGALLGAVEVCTPDTIQMMYHHPSQSSLVCLPAVYPVLAIQARCALCFCSSEAMLLQHTQQDR